MWFEPLGFQGTSFSVMRHPVVNVSEILLHSVDLDKIFEFVRYFQNYFKFGLILCTNSPTPRGRLFIKCHPGVRFATSCLTHHSFGKHDHLRDYQLIMYHNVYPGSQRPLKVYSPGIVAL